MFFTDTDRCFKAAVIFLFVVSGACSGSDRFERQANASTHQLGPKEEVLLVVWDTSESPTPESQQAWRCDLGKHIKEEFKCGIVEIIKVTADSFAPPPQTFEVKCPQWVPVGREGGKKSADEKRRVQEEKEQVLKAISDLRPQADHTDLAGAIARAVTDLADLGSENGKMELRVYSDFQASRPTPRDREASSRTVLSDVKVYLIFGAPQSKYRNKSARDPARYTSEVYEDARAKWTPSLMRLGLSGGNISWKAVQLHANCD